MKIWNWRWNRLQGGLETVWKAHERALNCKAFIWVQRVDETNGLRECTKKTMHIFAAQQSYLGAGVNETEQIP